MPPEAFLPSLSITDSEFSKLRDLVRRETGIALSDLKKSLMVSRLSSRLRHRRVPTFAAYYRLLISPGEQDELQTAIDLITTNETSFFREEDHFQVLRDHLARLRPVPFPFRVWSAASSSGEEAYSIAMVLADQLGAAEWEVVGTDISTRVLERARKGLYPLERSTTIPKEFLRRYCLKGQDRYEGLFLVGKSLRERVRFLQANLCQPLPDLGRFHLIFLRNILIYFDPDQKRRVVEAVIEKLAPGGLLIVGHSESLNGLTDRIAPLRPTVYRVA